MGPYIFCTRKVVAPRGSGSVTSLWLPAASSDRTTARRPVCLWPLVAFHTVENRAAPGNRQTGSQARHRLPQQAHLTLSLPGLTSGPFAVANASRVLGSSLFEVLCTCDARFSP